MEPLTIRVEASTARAGLLRELVDVLRDYPGNHPVVIMVGTRTFEYGETVDAFDILLLAEIGALGFFIIEPERPQEPPGRDGTE